jgi:tetratricopeptide (TPR) repeat protein
VLRDLGDSSAGLEHLKRALVLRRGVLGKEDVAVGETLNNLAVCYYMRGACNKAVELYEEALQIFIAHAQGSEEHPMVVLTYYNMALAYQQLDVPQTQGVLRKAMLLAEMVFGEEHEVTGLIRETFLKQVRSAMPEEAAKAAAAARANRVGPAKKA